MFQKIIESHLRKTLSDGSMVLELDWVWGHEITTPNAILDAEERGIDVVFNPNKIKMMIDHVNPAKDTASAIQGKIVRDWCKKHGIEFLDVGRNGVCHAIIPEKGWILPGQFGIMGDSHTCTHGAFGAFAAGVGTTELEIGMITRLWICPPQKVIRINFNGKLPGNVFAKDLILTAINKIGVKGATNAVLEFGGNVISEMSMEGRMTITNMAVEAGATSGMMMVDMETINYLHLALIKEAREDNNFDISSGKLQEYNSDSDAEYNQVINIDVTDMVPVITNNYSPGDVVKVSELDGKKVDQVYIGSCTNGRLSDLRIAASIIKLMGGRISNYVRCVVVPATQHVYEQAIQEGLIDIFVRAGCFVSGPTCGACLGMSCGVLAPGEVCVSTTNRNFHGRMGKGGMVHLASPATAAVTAVLGEITSIDTTLGQMAKNEERKRPLFETVYPTSWREVEFEEPDYSLLIGTASKPKHEDFSGKAFYLPMGDVNTDQIIPAKYLNEVEKKVFGKHCLEDVPISPEVRQQMEGCQIIVAGENFGCGSSREHASWALEGAGIWCVIAPSFARIFENGFFANGLLCITASRETIDFLMKRKPNVLFINLNEGIVKWDIENGEEYEEWISQVGNGPCFKFNLSDYQKDLIKNGGSVGVMLKLAAELQKEGKI